MIILPPKIYQFVWCSITLHKQMLSHENYLPFTQRSRRARSNEAVTLSHSNLVQPLLKLATGRRRQMFDSVSDYHKDLSQPMRTLSQIPQEKKSVFKENKSLYNLFIKRIKRINANPLTDFCMKENKFRPLDEKSKYTLKDLSYIPVPSALRWSQRIALPPWNLNCRSPILKAPWNFLLEPCHHWQNRSCCLFVPYVSLRWKHMSSIV